MATIIRHATGWAQGDAFICDGQNGKGVWKHRGRENFAPMEFANEADARRFLATNGYDLPMDKVTFEQTERAPVWADTPLTRCAAASLPLLIEAHTRLHGVAAPQASRIADRIAAAMADLIDIAGEVEAYGNKWCDGDMGKLAESLRNATAEFNKV